jgi:hypothetical protein
MLGFARNGIPLLGVGRRFLFDGNIGPNFRKFSVQAQPFLKAGLGVGLDRVDRALGLAHAAIDAFVRVDDEHILAFVEAVDRTYLDTVHILTFDTALVDDVSHLSLVLEGWPSPSESSKGALIDDQSPPV